MSDLEEINYRLTLIESEVAAIKARNARVESDKAWERSRFRVMTLSTLTYLTSAFIFYIIGVEKYFVSGLVPTFCYFVSTQSLPVIKNWWIVRTRA